MADLDQFPSDIYQTLIALPYRVGLYVSLSDQTGGQESEAKELAALENVVTFYVEDTLKSEFAQDIMLAMLQNKAMWGEWREGIERLPAECRDTLAYLEDRIEARKLAAFKSNLLEIALAVAMAYHEGGESMSFFERIRKCFSFGAAKTETSTPAFNISRAEKIAINQLAESFGIDYKVA